MRLLLVDDNLLYLTALVRLLANSLEVVAVSSPARALDLIRDGTYDALVTDNDMPGMSGIELLKKARVICPRMRRVLMSAQEPDGIDVLLESALAHAFLLKPFSKERLLACLATAPAPAAEVW